uniref:sn-1-specific diacylglycerol lipase ABHD11 n=1 Tax=Plectus sambesii TaxID=2011161 RepID=A0A914WBB0_9BILA
DTSVRQFLLTNLYQKSDGSIAWRLNLPALKDYLNDVIGFSSIKTAASSFDGPTLFLTGSKSPYVTDADHPQIKKLFPNATFDVIQSAGHWVHADRPQDFIDSVHKFLR